MQYCTYNDLYFIVSAEDSDGVVLLNASKICFWLICISSGMHCNTNKMQSFNKYAEIWLMDGNSH